MDRFFFRIRVGYPTVEEEMKITEKISRGISEISEKVLTPKELQDIQNTIESEVFVDDKIHAYAVALVRASREQATFAELSNRFHITSPVFFGASPRASIALIRAAKTLAACLGRDFVLPDDIKQVAHEVLEHRIHLSYSALGAGITEEMIVDEMLTTVRVS